MYIYVVESPSRLFTLAHLVQGFRLSVFALISHQLAVVVQRHRHVGMVRPKHLLPYDQRLLMMPSLLSRPQRPTKNRESRRPAITAVSSQDMTTKTITHSLLPSVCGASRASYIIRYRMRTTLQRVACSTTAEAVAEESGITRSGIRNPGPHSLRKQS